MMDAKQNMRVDVYDLDKHYLGAGMITKVEPLEVEMEDGTVEVLVENYPAEIKLDNGEIMEGMNCWWEVIDEPNDNEIKCIAEILSQSITDEVWKVAKEIHEEYKSIDAELEKIVTELESRTGYSYDVCEKVYLSHGDGAKEILEEGKKNKIPASELIAYSNFISELRFKESGLEFKNLGTKLKELTKVNNKERKLPRKFRKGW